MKLRGLQKRVWNWVNACFGYDIAIDKQERSHRFLEEALELVQATGTTKEDALTLVDYVFNRPVGEIYQEVGGVMVTLSGLCNCLCVDMSLAADLEVSRIESPRIMEKIRIKQQSKPATGPLPSGPAQAMTPEDIIIRHREITGVPPEHHFLSTRGASTDTI